MQQTTVVRLARAALAASLLWAACGRDEPGGTGGRIEDPCAGKACGATCMACGEGDPDCGVLGYCSADAKCALPFPVCPPPPECTLDTDCAQIESCMKCPDGSMACPETRCIEGECTTQFPECPAECETPADCPQLGMPCQECPDGSIACPGFDCIDGACVAKYTGCAYEPCAGKACGAACTVCDPADPDCAETAVLKFCDASGVCRPSFPECPPPPACQSDDNCPGVGACPRCPGDLCAELHCIEGSCRFTCPPAPPPECTTDADCPMIGMPCLLCPDGWAACPSMACLGGACKVSFPTCDGHDPCSGKSCGELCSLCGDACASPVAMHCDASGACTVGPVECTPDAICRLPVDPGPCDAAIPRFYFDDVAGKCRPFTYGGCEGNANNFPTGEECVGTCAPGAVHPCTAITCDVGSRCVYPGISPVCAIDCGAAGECPSGFGCGCAGSCPACEDCRRVCLPLGSAP